MTTVTTSKGRQAGDGSPDTASNQTLAEPYPEQLRNLIFNYLCHNCYLKTAQAFAKDSTIGYLDTDGDEIHESTLRGAMSSVDLTAEMVMNIRLRQRIRLKILSGNVQEAIDLLSRHFPKVLSEEDSDEMEITDENLNPSRFEYVAETINPTHLSLNLRILAFIEACRTVPLVYMPPTCPSTESPASPDSDVVMASASPIKRDPKEEEDHQSELLICVQNLYATVNGLGKSEDRAIYLKELSNVGGLLAYTVPENSPMAKYLRQERRDRVADQINSAVLHHTHMPSVSSLELAVRYTHCLWAMLHELRAKVPATHRLSNVLNPLKGQQGTGESEKEPLLEARPFDLQGLLDART